MAKLSSKMRSHVRTLFEWPARARVRGWGLRRDQIWFPEPTDDTFIPTGRSYVTPIQRIEGRWYGLYLDRRMLMLGPITIRYHVFYQGDDNAAVHDHPWWFVTFPLNTYSEVVERTTASGEAYHARQKVRRFRFHYRGLGHRHYVCAPFPGDRIRTIVVHGPLCRDWGFYPPSGFVSHREWSSYDQDATHQEAPSDGDRGS